MQYGSARVIYNAYVCTIIKQELYRRFITHSNGPVQRCLAISVDVIDNAAVVVKLVSKTSTREATYSPVERGEALVNDYILEVKKSLQYLLN